MAGGIRPIPHLVLRGDGRGRIDLERNRQRYTEGFTSRHDDRHTAGELLDAARCYATSEDDRDYRGTSEVPAGWSLGTDWWKPKDRTRDLERAGALCEAEIDRLARSGVDVHDPDGPAAEAWALLDRCIRELDAFLATKDRL